MTRKRVNDKERSVIEKQIEEKAAENRSFKVPDLKELDEHRPQTTVSSSLSQLLRDLLRANHGDYAKLLVNCSYRETCLGNQAAIGLPPDACRGRTPENRRRTGVKLAWKAR